MKLEFIFVLFIFCSPSKSYTEDTTEHLSSIIKKIKDEECRTHNEQLSLASTPSASSKLISINYRMIKNKNTRVGKKIAMTLFNIPAVPIAFIGDIIFGASSKTALKANHVVMHDKNHTTAYKASLTTGTALALPWTICFDQLYHYFVQLPLLSCALVGKAGGDHTPIKNTRNILASIQDGDYDTFRFNRLKKKVNRTSGSILVFVKLIGSKPGKI